MTFKSLAFAALAAAALAAPAFASPVAPPAPPAPPTPPHHSHCCINLAGGMTEEQQARLEARMARLDDRLARLGPEIDARVQEAVRRANIQGHVAKVQARAEIAQDRAMTISATVSPERIRAITNRAMASAHAGEVAAEATQRALAGIQPQLDALANMDWNIDVQVDD